MKKSLLFAICGALILGGCATGEDTPYNVDDFAQGGADVVVDDAVVAVDGGVRPAGLNVLFHPDVQPFAQRDAGVGGGLGAGQGKAHLGLGRDRAQGDAGGSAVGI